MSVRCFSFHHLYFLFSVQRCRCRPVLTDWRFWEYLQRRLYIRLRHRWNLY